MVQAWYQGGISVFDWTDTAHPKEIAFFDRGPVDSTRMRERRLVVGVLVQRRHRELRDLARPRHLRADAERVHLAERDRCGEDGALRLPNAQGQPKIVWPASFALSRAYSISSSARTGSPRRRSPRIARRLKSAEKASGSARSTALTQLATQINADASGSSDATKVQKLSASVKALAGTQ